MRAHARCCARRRRMLCLCRGEGARSPPTVSFALIRVDSRRRLASPRLAWQIMEVHTDDYKRIFGGSDGPGAACSEVVPEGALFLPQGGADAAAEEVCEDAWRCFFGVHLLFAVVVVVVSVGRSCLFIFLFRGL